MGEDDNGNGYAAGIGKISDLKPDDASSKWCENFSFAKVWELWPQLEYSFPSNWSTDGWLEHPIFSANWSTGTWFGDGTESCQISLGCQGQSVLDTIPYSSARCALPSLVLICFLTALVFGQPEKKPSPKRTPRPSIAREWNDLPAEIQGRVIGRLPFEQVCQLKAVSKTLRHSIEDADEFLSLLHLDSVTLTAPYFYIKDGVLQCAGYDSSLKKWRRLPPITYLPDYCTPDRDLFKEYLVCTQDGILCVNVSKSSTEEKLIVFNLLTRKWKRLPPLNHRRNPVLMHMLVDAATQSFQVIVAGSAKSVDEHLSKMTEVFDSRTWTWKRTGDLPGPDYALNDYQCGVRLDGHLLCIAFLDDDAGRGILRYNLTKGIWLKDWTCPLPCAVDSTILQLVENRGDVYLFSEQSAAGGGVQHCIDRLERISNCCVDSWKLRNVVRQKKKTGGRSLEIYPEYVCVGYSDSQLIVFNAMDHSGVLYDVKNCGTREEVLEAPTGTGFSGDGFYSLNPLSFAIQPSFRMKI